MEVLVKIQGTEGLEKAILQLAQTLANYKGEVVQTPAQVNTPAQAISQHTYQQPAQQYQAPIQSPAQPLPYQVPVQQPAQQFPINTPVTQQPPTQAPTQQVPTSHAPQAFTQDQLAVAMTAMCDVGKVDTIMSILAQFGAETLMQVPKEMYPTLAMMLRGAGANI